MTLVSCVSTTERCDRGSLRRREDGAVTFLYTINSGYDDVNTLGLARVYVTSNSDAMALGAAGGVKYTHSRYGFPLLWLFSEPAIHNDILYF